MIYGEDEQPDLDHDHGMSASVFNEMFPKKNVIPTKRELKLKKKMEKKLAKAAKKAAEKAAKYTELPPVEKRTYIEF